jgi:predicted Zn-dependent peptidase
MLPCIQLVSSAAVIFDLEADRISSLSIDLALLKAKEVLYYERRTGLENSPWRLLSQSMQQLLFKNIPHWPVMGYEDDMKNWNQQDLGVILKHTMHQITVLSLVVLSKPK